MFTIGKFDHVFRFVVKHPEPLIASCSSNARYCSLVALCGSSKFIYLLEGCVLKVIPNGLWYANLPAVLAVVWYVTAAQASVLTICLPSCLPQKATMSAATVVL